MTTHGTFTFDAANDADCQAFTFTSGGNGQASAGVISAAGTAADFCHDTNGGNSTNVGPDSGQGGNPDGYLYTETSNPGAAGDQYTMVFNTVLDASAEQWQFNFYTCQRGPANGNNLSTYEVQINESSGGWVTVTGASWGGDADDTTTSTWVSRSVDLSDSGANTDSSTQVRILITSQNGGSTFWSDVGIDTVQIVGTPLVSTITATASLDTAIQASRTATLSAGAAVSKSISGTASLDGAASASQTTTLSIDANLQLSFTITTATLSMDALVGPSKPFTISPAFVSKYSERSFGVPAGGRVRTIDNDG